MSAMPSPAFAHVASLRARLWDAGFRPVVLYSHDNQAVPHDHRGKRPKGDAWEERARRDPPHAAVASVEAGAMETGILCDGLRALDLDVDDKDAAATLRQLARAMLPEAPLRWRDNSPRVLLLYRAAEGEPPKLTRAGSKGKVEVLGRGQQCAAYGRHPSGAELRWEPEPPHELGLDALPSITEAQLGAFLAAACPIIGAEPPNAEDAKRGGTGAHRPSARGPSADPLDVAAALAAIPNNGPPDWEHWNRIGMAAWAATSGSETGFAAWAAWSGRNPAHDPADCRKRWEHYPEAPPGSIGAGSLFHMAAKAWPGWTKPSAAGRGVKGGTPDAPPWLGILFRTRLPAPALPLDVFGPWWAAWIERAADGANAPPDYVTLPLLAGASALIGNARWARAWRGWAEPPVLWCASVGNPSSSKSAGAAPVTRDVLRLVEARMARTYPDDIARWQEVAAIAAAVEKQWERDVANAAKKGTAMPARSAEATAPPKPVRPRASVSDSTVEKLATILQGLPKGVLHRRDELAGWLLNLSRYSGGTDRPFWLEAYVGGPYQVDRQKHPEPLFVPHLAVPVFGTIQPDRLDGVLTGADDGLGSRFLWAWPEAQPFRRPGSAADVDAAAHALGRLADLAMPKDAEGCPCPSYVPLSGPAADALETFAGEMQAREAEAHGLLKSALGKARGQALRLALVLEYLWWCSDPSAGTEPCEIGERAMQAAAGLMEGYFLPMAERVLGDASVPVEERLARTLAQWIVRTRPEVVNVSAVRDAARLDGLRETAPIKQACRFLADARWLAPLETTGQGRPRGDWQVNPALWAALVEAAS